mmetsp:Transcript_13808/g.13872  ORF Transcript_13808/g.13872 Transcript_13808/m.13872 type:complete len:482 (-) Transcript_13808:34-1479(-)
MNDMKLTSSVSPWNSLSEVVRTVAENVSHVDSIVKSYLEKNHMSGAWKNSSATQAHFAELKNSAKLLSDSITKIAVISSANPKVDAVVSIANEIITNSNNFLAIFILISKQDLGKPLLLAISSVIRSLLSSSYDLLSLLFSQNFKYINSATGAVWKASEAVQLIPLSNRNAYRRRIMELIGIMKDTHREFTEYINNAKEKLKEKQNKSQDNNQTNEREKKKEEEEEEEEEDDDMDWEQEPYNDIEVFVLEQYVSLVKILIEAMRTGMQVITIIADTIDSEILSSSSADPTLSLSSSLSSCPPSVSSTVSPSSHSVGDMTSTSKNEIINKNKKISEEEHHHTELMGREKTVQISSQTTSELVDSNIQREMIETETETETERETEREQCRKWVSEVMSSMEDIQNAVVDVGGELYAPIDLDHAAELYRVAVGVGEKYIVTLYRCNEMITGWNELGKHDSDLQSFLLSLLPSLLAIDKLKIELN